MARKILSIYDGISNIELYELAAICVDRCKTDLRIAEKRVGFVLDDIEELDAERMVLRMSVRE